MADLLPPLIAWGAAGSVIFTLFLLAMRSLGVVDSVRERDGSFKPLSLTSLIGLTSMLVLMIGFPALGAASLLGPEAITYWRALTVAYGIFFIINLYDFVVLDYLVIVRWHPAFLQLPETDYYRTTRPHAEGFARGCVIGVPTSLASAGLALVLV